ncbi:hypothetical protein [Nostoc sp. 'Peltigera malacea cyanobiont' DB3992]|uniref:hypothetical protein n=1 Tax=Nostoc sp. 'Peltigera malacea cyanobiont' DB3992 TaxID=1206980 RepID=UPI00211EFA4E|nr:hypothetical protein [Nostoc sp. 'Peltigera malacea cyanobiont' DB3992]
MNPTPKAQNRAAMPKAGCANARLTKEKGSSYRDEGRQPTNPALARGPKPVKPPAPKVQTEELETESESISEESQE